MDTIFLNSENSRTPKPHVLALKLINKLDLRIGKKVIALSNVSIYYTWKNIKSSDNKNRFKISAPTLNDEFNLPDGSYSSWNFFMKYSFSLTSVEKISLKITSIARSFKFS